jgi:cytochrome c-type biogenesis protein CcmF
VNALEIRRAALLIVGVAAPPVAILAAGALNPGQALTWIAFLASLVSGLAWLAAMGGRGGASAPARTAFVVQWFAYGLAAVFLWWILFRHQFQYQYVASYSSRSMPGHYVYSAFWGGQEGTFMLWAFLTCTLGLVLMRVRHALTTPAMFFLNLPLVMLGLVTVMRGPFLTFPPGQVPPDGNGLNPLLQDPWMTIHPPVLFIGFSSLVVPFAIAMAAMVRRDYDGWIRPVLPWSVFSTAILATGFIMGGVWAYKVLGWGGYWGWDPVENGSLIPWLCNMGLLHGLLVQRVTGSLRRSNLFLAVTSYVLVLYASFLTRSGVLADFSVHSFVNLGLNGFLLSFLFLIAIAGYGLLLFRLREIAPPKEPLGNFSRESMMWLGQLVFMLMTLLTGVGMSAPLITRLFGPPSNVQTSYYNLVNGVLAIFLGLLLGIAPLMRWRSQEMASLARAAGPPAAVAVLIALVAMLGGVREPLPAAVVFAAAFALAANTLVTLRGFRAGWKHGIAYLGHMGVAVLLIGVVASSHYGSSVQVQLPQGQERSALGYRLRFDGMQRQRDGKDHARIAVASSERNFEAEPALYWSEYNQGYMKKPHIERFLTHDVYISPLDMVGGDREQRAVWFSKGETRMIGQVRYTFEDFEVSNMGTPQMRVAARLVAEVGGRSVPVKPAIEPMGGTPRNVPGYLPGGGTVQIANLDPSTGRVALDVPDMQQANAAGILAVEVSTKPLINLVWIGSILMLASAFLGVVRRAGDLKRATADTA